MKLPLNFCLAISSLKAHRWRALLAMLGVFLGALAFSGVQHVSKIMVRQAEIQAEKLGPNSFLVMAGKVRFSKKKGVRIWSKSRTFTLRDAQSVIDGVPSIIEGTPYVTAMMPLRGGGNTVASNVFASWPNYTRIRHSFPQIGRFFTWKEVEERAKVCVLGQTTAERLFGDSSKALGKDVRIYRANFKVVGVMEPKGRDVAGDNQDEYVFLPLTTFMRRASNQSWIDGVYTRLAKGTDLDQATASATAIMRAQHHIRPLQEDDFSIMSPRDAIRLQKKALELMTTLGGITSLISFAVGGLGIVSIMILVVRSRRVEIGVRRAVGGRRQDIIRQFLFESGLMSSLGGGLGVSTTAAIVVISALTKGIPMELDLFNLFLTLSGSCLLGLVAGAYPAWQASSIEILDVLKR